MQSKSDAHPSLLASSNRGITPRTYVQVHIRSKRTRSSDWKLKSADCWPISSKSKSVSHFQFRINGILTIYASCKSLSVYLRSKWTRLNKFAAEIGFQELTLRSSSSMVLMRLGNLLSSKIRNYEMHRYQCTQSGIQSAEVTLGKRKPMIHEV